MKKRIALLFLALLSLLAGCDTGVSDTTAPSALDITGISCDNDSVTIVWDTPTDSDFSYVQISYSGISVTSTETSEEISGLTSETEYTFTLVAVDTSGNESDDVSLTFSTNDDSTTTETTFTLIETAVELSAISSDLAGSYILLADIDLLSSAWTSIGVDDSTPFTGKLFGNNHVVSNLYINNSDDKYQGLFGYTSGAIISDLGLEDLDVTGSTYTGGLVGYNDSGTISDC